MTNMIKHNISPIGASTHVKYSLSTFKKREDGILSTDLKNITLVNNENVTVINVPLSEIRDFKRRENTLEITVSEQRFIIQFGNNTEYVAPFMWMNTPGLRSTIGSRVMSESGQVYWTELINKFVPLNNDSSAISRLGWTNKFDAILNKILLATVPIIFVIWLLSLIF